MFVFMERPSSEWSSQEVPTESGEQEVPGRTARGLGPTKRLSVLPAAEWFTLYG